VRLPDRVQVWWTTRQTFINDAPDPVAFERRALRAPEDDNKYRSARRDSVGVMTKGEILLELRPRGAGGLRRLVEKGALLWVNRCRSAQ
jgi:hypothetical protein